MTTTTQRPSAKQPTGPLPARFGLLWLGQTVSGLGSEVALLALPMVAAVTLGGTATQLGGLTAAYLLPWLLALPIGAWTDRSPARPLLLTAELVRAAAIGAVPVAWSMDLLSYPLLYTLAAIGGTAGVFFETAWGSLLPRITERDALITVNARLAAGRSVTAVAGPGAGGLLVRAIGAPGALVADVASYLVSAFTIWKAIPTASDVPAATSGEPIVDAVRAGLRVVWRHPLLRALGAQAAIWNAASGAAETLFLLYAVRELHLDATAVGVLLMIGGVGAAVGAAATPRLLRHVSFGRVYLGMVALAASGMLLIPLAPALPLIAAGQALVGIGIAVTAIQAASIRQVATPPHLLGRTIAAYRLLSYGTIPLGGLLGGVLGDAVGLRVALVVAAAAGCAALIPLLCSAIRTLHELPIEETS